MTLYYADLNGKYLGGYSGSVPENAVETGSPPEDGRQIWDGTKFLPLVKNAYEQMSELEATRTPRREREARMGVLGSQQWLDDLDSEIEALRPEL